MISNNFHVHIINNICYVNNFIPSTPVQKILYPISIPPLSSSYDFITVSSIFAVFSSFLSLQFGSFLFRTLFCLLLASKHISSIFHLFFCDMLQNLHFRINKLQNKSRLTISFSPRNINNFISPTSERKPLYPISISLLPLKLQSRARHRIISV